LCLGDLGHKSLGRLRDAGPLVLLAKAIVQRWPAGRPLEYLHAPLAAGEDPPPADPAFYRPLERLKLPGEPTLADVQREFPDWTCWRDTSGMLYARRSSAASDYEAKGEDPTDLRDQINRAEALSEQ
jgi:hypothetical protein